ncbi:hypothetical protein MMC30_001444 [Trapelia coarctata]|nr:hypothetical protein [Trapelia coarctata]
MPPLTWLVTGCSSGIGEKFVHALLARGDQVIATARNASERLQPLKDAGAAILDLDVTASQTVLDAKVKEAIAIYGRLDVLVNNAGYLEVGAVEERFLSQFSTNFFGVLKTTGAVLPHFREKRSGTAVFIGSIAGVSADLGGGPYCSSKFALEGLVDTLRQELAPFGIRTLMVEPGHYRTEIWGPSNLKTVPPSIPDYDGLNAALAGAVSAIYGRQRGDPLKAVERIIDIAKGEGMAKGKAWPERLPLGPDALEMLRANCKERLRVCEEWEELITSTDLEPGK